MAVGAVLVRPGKASVLTKVEQQKHNALAVFLEVDHEASGGGAWAAVWNRIVSDAFWESA